MTSVGTEESGDGSRMQTARSESNAERQAAIEEELFSSWNTNTVSNILHDVRRFESQVFANIEKQLDFLRRRQGSIFLNVEELNSNFNKLNENMDMVNSIVDRNSVYRSRRASMGGTAPPARAASTVDFSAAAADAVTAVNGGQNALNTIQEGQGNTDVSGLQTELQELRSDFDELKAQFLNNHSLEHRFKTMEDWISAQLKEQSRKIDGVHELLASQKDVQDKILQRLDSMDQDLQTRMETMRQDLENKIQALEYAQMGITKDIEVKVHGLKDTLSIHDLRAKGIESKVARVSTNLDELREQHDQLQVRYFDQIYSSINELYAEKASKSDLQVKADLVLALSKADQSDIDRLQGITDELQRRLIALLAETSDKVNAMDAKLDRRSDRIVTYCLKELKKEFRHLKNTGGDNNDDAPEGTHIGKVRCLVCDHVSTQHRDQDVVHSQHDKLTHTLKSLRPRSPSPDSPHSPERRPTTANATLAGQTRPMAAEDGDDQADFRFRASNNNGQKLPVINGNTNASLRASVPNLAQSAPLIQIISHHLPVDVKMHQAQQLQQQQQQQQLQMSMKQAQKMGGTAGGGAGTTMFSNTANAVIVKAAELYPQQYHDSPSPHHNNQGGNNVTSSNAALSRPKSAPPKRA